MDCQKKKFSKIGAMFALAVNRQKKKPREEIRYYYCHRCRAYHLTSKPYFHIIAEQLEVSRQEDWKWYGGSK